MRFRFVSPCALLATCAAVLFAAPVRADVVDYSTAGFSTVASPLTINGLTATSGGAEPFGLSPAGLGVVGGLRNTLGANDYELLDTSESVLFQFAAGRATGVSFTRTGNNSTGGTSPFLNLEGFGVGGNSLGVVPFNIFTGDFSFDVSDLFGNVALSGFRVSGNGSPVGFALGSVTFTPAAPQAAVPEPGTLALLLLGTLTTGAGFLRRRRA